jgi:hypothetical protein
MGQVRRFYKVLSGGPTCPYLDLPPPLHLPGGVSGRIPWASSVSPGNPAERLHSVQVGDLWEAVPPWYRLPYSRFAAPQAGPKDGETTWGETAKCNTPRPPEGGRQPAGAQL